MTNAPIKSAGVFGLGTKEHYTSQNLVTDVTQYCVHSGLQQIKGSLAKNFRILSQETLPLVDLQIFNVNANACTKFLKQLHFNPVNKISLHEFKEVPISLISEYTSQTLDFVLGILKCK